MKNDKSTKEVAELTKKEMLHLDKLLQSNSMKDAAKMIGMTYAQLVYRCELSPVLDKIVKDAMEFKRIGVRPMGYLNFHAKEKKEAREDIKFTQQEEISPQKALENFQKKIKEDREDKYRHYLRALRDIDLL